MAENNNLPSEIVYSEKMDYNVKKEILDAINTSKNILSDIKQNHPNSEKYKTVLKEYNNLHNEILLAYESDKEITKDELEGLKDEIESIKKHDERGGIEKQFDSITDYFSISNEYESINHDTLGDIKTNLNEINNKSAEYFYENPDSIIFINNSQKLNEVLKVFTDNNKSIDATYINTSLFNEFVIKPGVTLNFYNYKFISKENLENNLDKLMNLQEHNSYREFILLEACNKGVNKDTIRSVIEKNNIEITFHKYIEVYLGKETISNENFKEQYEKNGSLKYREQNLDEKIQIIEFISKNINNEEYTDIIIDYIQNAKLSGELVHLNIQSIPILKELINQNINNTRYVPIHKVDDPEIINSFLENLNKQEDLDADDILWNMDHIIKNTDNVSIILKMFSSIKNNMSVDFNEVLDMFSDEEYMSNMLNLFSKSKEEDIPNEYKSIYSEISNVINNDLQYILKLQSESNDFNVRNKNMNSEQFEVLGQKLNEKLNGLDNGVKEKIVNEISKLKNNFNEDINKKIFSILKEGYPDYKTNPEFKKYLNIILEVIGNFNETRDKESIKSIVVPEGKGGGGNKYGEIDENGETKLNYDRIKQDFLKLTEGKTTEEKIKIREEFIKNNFENFSEEDKEKIKVILSSINQNENIKVAQENVEEFIEYMDLQEANPDSKVDFKEYLEIKPKLDDPTNNFYISETDDYSPVSGGFSLKGKNGETIEGLVITEDEKNLTLGNPEATENLINFYTFFEDLNLEGVWKYRKELITAIGDVTINANDGDSIKESELRRFGNNLLTFIANVDNEEGHKEQINLSSISAVNHNLRNFSGAGSSLSDSKTFNIEGEDKFTSYLRNQGIIGGAFFRINKFRENLK